MQFEKVSDEDVAILAVEAADLNVEAEACAQIVKKADGDFRLVWTLLAGLEQAARTRDTNTVDAKMVDAVSRKSLNWRR